MQYRLLSALTKAKGRVHLINAKCSKRHRSSSRLSQPDERQTEADLPSLDVHAGSKCVVLAGLQHTPSLAPDKTVKHADRFPILTVCQARFPVHVNGIRGETLSRVGKWQDNRSISFSLLLYSCLRTITSNCYWWFIIPGWRLLIAKAHERVLSFPSRWLQI